MVDCKEKNGIPYETCKYVEKCDKPLADLQLEKFYNSLKKHTRLKRYKRNK